MTRVENLFLLGSNLVTDPIPTYVTSFTYVAIRSNCHFIVISNAISTYYKGSYRSYYPKDTLLNPETMTHNYVFRRRSTYEGNIYS